MKVHAVVLRTASGTADLIVHKNLNDAYKHYQSALRFFRDKDIYLYSARWDEALGSDGGQRLFDVLFSLGARDATTIQDEVGAKRERTEAGYGALTLATRTT